LDARRFDSSSSIKGNNALTLKLYNMKLIIQKSTTIIMHIFVVALGLTALFSFGMLFAHLLTHGI